MITIIYNIIYQDKEVVSSVLCAGAVTPQRMAVWPVASSVLTAREASN